MENIHWDIVKQFFGALIRYGLFSLATFLVTKGWVDPALANAFVNEATAIVLGVLIYLITFGWKYANARFHILAFIKAVQMDPPADTPREIKQAVEEVKAEVKAENTIVSSV
jgi:hypothetical protein